MVPAFSSAISLYSSASHWNVSLEAPIIILKKTTTEKPVNTELKHYYANYVEIKLISLKIN